MARGAEFTVAFQTDKSPAEYQRLAVAAETLGFDGISVFADLGFHPPVIPLSLMAAATSRVRLGAACQNPLLTHPIEIAGQVAGLWQLSQGRTYLGLARGAWLEGLGIDHSRPLTRLKDAAEIVTRLLAGDRGGYSGSILSLPPGLGLSDPLPDSRVEVLIGTWGQRTARWAATVADEVKVGGSANPDMVRQMRNWLGGARTRIVMGAVTMCDLDRSYARSLARREVAMYLDVVAPLDPTFTVDPTALSRMRAALHQGDHEAAGAAVPDDVLDRFSFSGTPREICDRALELVDAGAARIEFGTPHGPDPIRALELLAKELIPEGARS